MKPILAIAVLTVALYRPAALEDTDWFPDPITRASNAHLPCEIIKRHADGTVDVIVIGADGRKHERKRQPVLVGPQWDGPGSGVILKGRGT